MFSTSVAGRGFSAEKWMVVAAVFRSTFNPQYRRIDKESGVSKNERSFFQNWCQKECRNIFSGDKLLALSKRTSAGSKKRKNRNWTEATYFSSIFRAFASGLGSFLETLSSRTPSFIVPSAFAGSTSSRKETERSNAEYARSRWR